MQTVQAYFSEFFWRSFLNTLASEIEIVTVIRSQDHSRENVDRKLNTNYSSIKGSNFSSSSIFDRNRLSASSNSLDNSTSLLPDDSWGFSIVASGIIVRLGDEDPGKSLECTN